MQPIQSPRHKLCMNPKHWPSPNNNSPPSRSGSVINLIVQLEGDGARLLLKQSAFHRVHPPAPSVPVMDLSLDPGRAPAKALLGQAVFFFRKGRRILFVFFLLPSTPHPPPPPLPTSSYTPSSSIVKLPLFPFIKCKEGRRVNARRCHFPAAREERGERIKSVRCGHREPGARRDGDERRRRG